MDIENLSIQITSSADTAVGAINRLSSALGGLKSGSRNAASGMKAVVDATEKVASSEQDAGSKARSFADELDKVKSKSSTTALKLKEITSAASSFGRVTFSPVTNSFKTLANGAIGAASSVKNLYNQISRVAFYRLIRTAIKAVTQGLNEGIKNLYHYSETFNGTFYQSMNRIATSANYLKNSLGAMVSPLINAVTPVLEVITDRIVDVFNLINQFIARLTGQSTYTAAKKVASLWDSSTQKAAASTTKTTKDAASKVRDTVKDTADEIKRYTLGFDELNILGRNDDGSGGDSGLSGALGGIASPSSGASGTAGTTDYGSMFETRNISGAVSDFADALRQAFMAQDWNSLGTLIGEKINSALDSVNWSGIGKKVGNALNGVIVTAYHLLDTINFTKIGTHIAEFLNNAIEQINFNTLGRLMVKKMTIIPDMIIGFFTGFDWGQDAAKLSDFAKGFYEELTAWFKRHKWSEIGATIAGKLYDVVTNIDFFGIAKNMYWAFDAALEAAIGILTGFIDGLAARIKGHFNWDSLSEDVKTQVTTITYILSGATGVLGAILAFSGANIPLGISLIAGSSLVAATMASMNGDGLTNLVKENMETIKTILSGASLVIGGILLFSGTNVPLGLGLLSLGAAKLGVSANENWGIIEEKLKGPIGALTELLGGATLALGFVALAAGRVMVGVGLIALGATALGVSLPARWDRLNTYLEGPIGSLTAILSGSLLALGFIAIAAGRIPLGMGLVISGAYGLATTLAARWDRLNEYVKGPLETLVLTISGAVLALGFVAIAAGRIPLGIGLIVSGATGLATTIPARWNRIQQYLEGPIGDLTVLISSAVLTLGFLVLAAGRIPLGLGLVVAGSAGLATTVAARWNRLHEYLEGPIGIVTGILSGASLLLGVLALVAGNVPLGLGLLLSGAAGLAGSINANWDSLKQLGIDAVKNFKEGWDSENFFEIRVTPKISTDGGAKKNATDWTPKFESSTETLQRYIDNLGKGVDLDIRVALVKDAWTSVADWATNTGVDVNAKVALVRASWTTVSEWANRYIGAKINQSVGLQRAGWTILSQWVEKYKDPKVVNQTIGLIKSGWSTVSNFVSQNMGGAIYKGIDLYVNNWNSFLGTVSGVLHNWFPSIFAEGGAIEHGKVSRFAGGGIINAYAGGTSSAHGSLFLAGEAGPEIVGHVGGRTEVLNRSQLAATMYAAVNAAMAPAAANFANAAAYMYQGAGDRGTEDMDMLLQLVRAGSEATERQNEILRQQNEYLRQINAKDFNPEISTASINRAQARTNRRAGTTIVPVSTQ